MFSQPKILQQVKRIKLLLLQLHLRYNYLLTFLPILVNRHLATKEYQIDLSIQWIIQLI